MKLLRLAALTLIVAVPVLVHSQSAAPPRPSAAPPPQATFRSGVELVRLDVRVVDDAGLPVKDIKAGEVRVFEGGTERPVVLFQHIAEPAGSYLEVARRTIGAEVSTNQGAPRGHLYVFVFDQAHITPGNEARARDAVARFLHTRVKPGDRVALYALPGPGPQIPFTSNINLALAELPKVRGGLDRQSFVTFGDMTDYEAYQVLRGNDTILQRILTRASAAGSSTTDVGSIDPTATATPRPNAAPVIDVSPMAINVAKSSAATVVGRADADSHSFLVALSDVIRDLARVEGRKSVILVSEGFFADNMTTDVDRVAAAAAEAYAVIYSLDVGRRGIDLSASAPTGADPFTEIQSRLEPLGTMSADTSGALVLDASAHVDEALNQIVSASQDYYVVGFEPPAAALADRRRYRRVHVSVTRPGVRVETRTGYALRDPATAADRRLSIDSALGAPFPQQELPIQMTTYVLRGASAGVQRVVMSLEASLPVASNNARKPADVVFVVRDARDGRVRTSGTDAIPLPRSPDSGLTTGRGRYRVQFDLPAGDYVMRAAVREPDGTTGTVDRRFEVPALDGVDIAASDLIIGNRSNTLPVRARSYVRDGLSGALEVYARRPADLDAVDVTVDLVPVDGLEAVRSARADLLDARSVGAGAGRPVQVLMPLDGVTPGEYVARARVRSRGETVTEVMRQVQIVSGAAPPLEAAAPVERVTPKKILGGELARRFVNSIAGSVSDPTLKTAAAQAQVGAWSNVSTLLGPPPASGARSADYHALLGLALFAGERYNESAASLDAALTLRPDSAPTAFILGWVHLNAGRAPEAITAWRNAVRLDPTMTSAYLALADTYVRLSHRELAVQILKSGLAVMPKSVELQSNLDLLEHR